MKPDKRGEFPSLTIGKDMDQLRGEGGVKHFFYMFIPSYREFYTESASFFKIKLAFVK